MAARVCVTLYHGGIGFARLAKPLRKFLADFGPPSVWLKGIRRSSSTGGAELRNLIQNDRYPLSPRIVPLREILGLLRPEPEREPLPPLRHYEPPSKGRYSRRSGG